MGSRTRGRTTGYGRYTARDEVIASLASIVETIQTDAAEHVREALKRAKYELDKCTRLKEHEQPGERWEPVDNVVDRIFAVDDVLCNALHEPR